MRLDPPAILEGVVQSADGAPQANAQSAADEDVVDAEIVDEDEAK